MTILVAGGAGFIGSHLCDKLIKEKHTVICVDNLVSGSEKNISHLISNSNFTFIKHDVIKPLKIEGKIDAVFHLASPASPNHYSKISYLALPMETMLVNTTGTINLLELARQKNAKFLFASTSEVYGDPLVHPQPETYNGNVSTTGPRSVYDEAKRFGETITAFYLNKYQVDARIARIFNTYGPRMLKEDLRMMVTFINQAKAEKDITVFGDGKQTRSLTFIDDMTEGLYRLMFYSNTKGEIINLGSTDEHSVNDYAKLVKDLTNSKSKIIHSEDLPKDDPKKRKPDISKAMKILNWKPLVNLKTGLTKMIKYN